MSKRGGWESYTVNWPTRAGTRRVSVSAQVSPDGLVSVRTVRERGRRVDLGTYSAGERFALYEVVRKAAEEETP